jgi:predicted Zn-dependent protease
MSKKINSGKMLSAVKKSIDFGMNNLSYKYVPPIENDKSIFFIKPDKISISLIGTIDESIGFTFGGLSNRSIKDKMSMVTRFSIDKNIITRNQYYPVSSLPLYSEEALFNYLKDFLIIHFPYFATAHISRTLADNALSIMAPKPKVNYVEEFPSYPFLYESLEKSFSKLNKKVYNLKNVFGFAINISNQLRFEVYVDSDGSEIVQYFNDVTISYTISFLNLNNIEVPLTIVDRFKTFDDIGDDYFQKKYDEILREMDFNKKYENLKSGVFPVLLLNDASDVFNHEALAAHLLSANYIVDGDSTIFTGRKGELLEGLKGVDILMDPTLSNGYGSFKYDCEGVEAKKVMLIEDGVILNYLTDRYSASQLEIIEKDELMIKQLLSLSKGDIAKIPNYVDSKFLVRHFDTDEEMFTYLLEHYLLSDFIKDTDGIDETLDWRSKTSRLTNVSNGHARVQSWTMMSTEGVVAIQAEARMSNLIIESRHNTSKTLEDEMKQYCIDNDFEFYLEVGARAGEVSPETGQFTIEPDKVVKVSVATGERTVIMPGTFSIHLEDFIKNIILVGSDNEPRSGTCGANSGWVPVGSETPRMIVTNIPYQAAVKVEQVSDEIFSTLGFKHKTKEED